MDISTDSQGFQIIFQGKVQGVGFRMSCLKIAQQLDVQGTVKNCHDGSVELKIFSSCRILDAFISALKSKFDAAIISIEITPICEKRQPESFDIIF